MRTVQMEFLRPDEIIAERDRKSIAYLPVGPLEWHGPAMPFGTDPLMAEYCAREAAKVTGGVVMPTLFFGTECDRPAYILEAKGFENPEDMYVLGMDVPKTNLKSFYAREEIFALMIREQLRFLVQTGYKLIVIVNGHGAWGQKGSIERLCTEFSNETPSKVITMMPVIQPKDMEPVDFGHGTKCETSLMCYIRPDDVKLDEYPPREVPLKYTDYGIADDFVFEGKRSENDCVVYDPRDATYEFGELLIKTALTELIGYVEAEYAKLS